MHRADFNVTTNHSSSHRSLAEKPIQMPFPVEDFIYGIVVQKCWDIKLYYPRFATEIPIASLDTRCTAGLFPGSLFHVEPRIGTEPVAAGEGYHHQV